MRRADEAGEVLRALPGGAEVLDAVEATSGAWVVGGAVRDALLGRRPNEIDVVCEDDPRPLIARLGATERAHERFGTATVLTPAGVRVDVVRARAESYAHPGALPDVRPGTLDEDLARRDLSINAMALRGTELRTVPGALDDLAAGRVRVLHDGSFSDDATRIWRAARYAARLDFRVEDRTRLLAALADPATVSGPRHGAELRRALAEPDPLAALRLTRELSERLLPPGLTSAPPRLDEALALLPDEEPSPRRDLVILAACCAPVDVVALLAWLDHLGFGAAERDIVAAGSRAAVQAPLQRARTNADIARAARGVPLEVVALAGGEQARRWIDDLRHVRLEITGDDLVAAGVPPGPDLGERLRRALDAKLEGRVAGRDEELRVALATAGPGGGSGRDGC